MKVSLNLLAILNLLGAAQGLLLTLALLKVKRGNRTANRLLAALAITISVVVTGAVLVTTNYVFVFPHLSRLHQPFAFLGGPLLFLYIGTLITNKKTFTRKNFLHFIPFALCLIYLLPYYFQGRAAKVASLYAEFYSQTPGGWYYTRSAIFIIQLLSYLIAITAILFKYSQTVRRGEATIENKGNLFKVRFFAIAGVILWAGAILRLVLDSTSETNLLVPLGASILVYAMCYLQMIRPEPVIESKELLSVRKYEKSRLTPERSQRYLKRLIEFMENQKPYTNGNLTVQKLAEELSIPTAHLSQTINEQLGQSFSEFLNSYRIDEAKRRLRDPAFKHLSILGIAEDVGFNSKSSFNAVFKKHTHITPSEFRNQYADVIHGSTRHSSPI